MKTTKVLTIFEKFKGNPKFLLIGAILMAIFADGCIDYFIVSGFSTNLGKTLIYLTLIYLLSLGVFNNITPIAKAYLADTINIKRVK